MSDTPITKPIDTNILPFAFKKLDFDTISLNWTQLWNDGTFGQQDFGFTLSPDIFLYLVDNGGEYSYELVAALNGSATPGAPADGSNQGARLGFQYRFDLAIKITNEDGTPIVGGQSITPRDTLPNNVNKTTQVTNSASSVHTDTYQVMSEGNTSSSSYTSSVERKTESGKAFQVTDWGVIDQSNAQQGLASWIWHQQTPYDIYTLNPSHFDKWFEDAYHKDHPLDVTELSKANLPISTTSTWRVDHDLVKAGSLPVRIEITATLYAAGVANPDYHPPDKHNTKTGHHRLWTGARSTTVVKVIDLAKEVGWWIPAAYSYEAPKSAPAFVGLGNWDERLVNYPNGNWKPNYQVRYAVSFYNDEKGETALGPFSEYQGHDPYIMPQLKDIPMDLSGEATERRLYRQFKGEDPVLVGTIPGYGPAGIYDENHV